MKKQLLLAIFVLPFLCYAQKNFYVAPSGNNNNSGTLLKPLKTLEGALKKANVLKGKDVNIYFRSGIYVMDKTVKISSANFTANALTIQPYQNEKVVFSGAKSLKIKWEPFKNGIYKANIEFSEKPDRLFLNGKALPMARYPNFDVNARIFNGTASNALDAVMVARWNNPSGAYVHALHSGEWGGFHYLVTGKQSNQLLLEGGWQNNRPSPMNNKYRFIENIFEELDVPNEWFYDEDKKVLYFYPPKGVNPNTASFNTSQITDILHVVGNRRQPVKNIHINQIDFTQTARSFMLTKEPLLRSDWTIYRGGAILLDYTENIKITNCGFYELGGNAIFMSNYNKHNLVKDNLIYNIGANAISFVGNPEAVRSPSFRYEKYVPIEQMDMGKGPKTDDYPQYCTASGNLIHHIGLIEKQVAGTQISMAANITVSHNTIYKVPRAGINISEGTWGGHIIEFNDVFDTVLETGDHGAFNSWGRDRYWLPNKVSVENILAKHPGIENLDVVDPIILRNNRFQCDHGWDIDLDDGSSNYLIYNNVCLSGGLKLREGYHRKVYNNIIINNTFHPHVWFKNSDDVFAHNIVTQPYAPIGMNDWGKQIDSNFFLSEYALKVTQKLGVDQNSTSGDALFINAANGNYSLKPQSPATEMGFKSFEMKFGVIAPHLKKLAEKPNIRTVNGLLAANGASKESPRYNWMGAAFKNIESLGEQSSLGLYDMNGTLLTDLPVASIAAKNGFQKGDVLIAIGNEKINSIEDLVKLVQKYKQSNNLALTLIRDQRKMQLNITQK